MKIERAVVINHAMELVKRRLDINNFIEIDISDLEWEIFLNILYEHLEIIHLSGEYSNILWEIASDVLSYDFYRSEVHYPLYLIKNNKVLKTGYHTNASITINSVLNSFIRVAKPYKIPNNILNEIIIEIKNNCLLGDIKKIIKSNH